MTELERLEAERDAAFAAWNAARDAASRALRAFLPPPPSPPCSAGRRFFSPPSSAPSTGAPAAATADDGCCARACKPVALIAPKQTLQPLKWA